MPTDEEIINKCLTASFLSKFVYPSQKDINEAILTVYRQAERDLKEKFKKLDFTLKNHNWTKGQLLSLVNEELFGDDKNA